MDDPNAFERQLEREVHRAFGPPRPVDVAAIVRTATTRSTPSTRSPQRSRWLTLPIPYRRTQRPTAADTTEFQPSPIPATNGHTPTVIGRTSSMLSPVKAITAGALVFGIGGVMLIAQPFGQQSSVPGAEVPAEGMEPAFFTGTLGGGWTPIGQGTVETRADGVIVTSGEGFANIEFTTNDPRMTGRLSMMKTEEDYREGVLDDSPTGEIGAMRMGWFRIDNEDGSWSGR